MSNEKTNHAANGWETLNHFVETYDGGLDTSIDEDALAAAADLIADVLHAVAGYIATGDTQDVLDTALMHYTEERAGA